MTLQVFRDPLRAGVAGAGTSRRDNLAFGSLFNRGPADELKIRNARRKPEPETPQQLLQALSRRNKIWELNASLHCSIIGTCLSTADLRQLLGKLNLAGAQTLSDHDLHKQGVSLAGQRDGSAKLLQKALDRKHQRVLTQFDQAKTDGEIAGLWDDAVHRGEIPGAYWATLTHPLTNEALVKRAFGEVHMLSHLVGAANRADIRRLAALEVENAELQAKIQRQQAQIHDIAVARDARINDLNTLLTRAMVDRSTIRHNDPAQDAAVVATLERRLSSEASHRQRIEERLKATADKLVAERNARVKAEQGMRLLSEELAIAEAGLIGPESNADSETDMLQGQTILYVGGKSGHVAALREIAHRFKAHLLHHDGGLEDRNPQLAGLISQAQIVFFPVDYVSHDAMQVVKRLSRQAGKPYIPLRSAGLASFLVALRTAGSHAVRSNVDAGF